MHNCSRAGEVNGVLRPGLLHFHCQLKRESATMKEDHDILPEATESYVAVAPAIWDEVTDFRPSRPV